MAMLSKKLWPMIICTPPDTQVVCRKNRKTRQTSTTRKIKICVYVPVGDWCIVMPVGRLSYDLQLAGIESVSQSLTMCRCLEDRTQYISLCGSLTALAQPKNLPCPVLRDICAENRPCKQECGNRPAPSCRFPQQVPLSLKPA